MLEEKTDKMLELIR